MKNIKTALFAAICAFFLMLSLTSIVWAANYDMPILKQGMNGDAVGSLQVELKEHGFYQIDVDGKFGIDTKWAVTEFQQATGLEPDGIVGPATWIALLNYSGNAEVSRGQPDNRKGRQIASMAQKFLGVPYLWGGDSPSGFDCSGFVHYVYSRNNISLPRMADDQYGVGRRIAQEDLEPGDLVFYSTYTPGPSHVGIYIGNGQFVHASSGAGEVTITPMSKSYYKARFLNAFRVIR